MQPTELLVGVMDSQREKLRVTLPVHQLNFGQRVLRGGSRFLLVSGLGAVFALVPLMHVCGAIAAVAVGPVVGIFGFLAKARLGAGQITCVKCSAPVEVADGVMGWPARVQCLSCKSMLELRLPERTS